MTDLWCEARCCVEYFYCLHNFLMCRSQAATATILLSIGVTKNIFGLLKYLLENRVMQLKNQKFVWVRCQCGTYIAQSGFKIKRVVTHPVQFQTFISFCFTSLPSYRSLPMFMPPPPWQVRPWWWLAQCHDKNGFSSPVSCGSTGAITRHQPQLSL